MQSSNVAKPAMNAGPHDATLRALLHFVDMNIEQHSSEEEWKEAIKGLGEHLNTHDGFVQCDSSKLWGMLGRLVEQYDRSPSAPLRGSRSRLGVLQKGSIGISAVYLETIGFVRDDIDELAADHGGCDASGKAIDMLERVVQKSAVHQARSCSALPWNEHCEGQAAAEVYFRGNLKRYCGSCTEWLKDEDANTKLAGCSNPDDNPNCLGKTDTNYLRTADHLFCRNCRTYRRQQERAQEEVDKEEARARRRAREAEQRKSRKRERQPSLSSIDIDEDEVLTTTATTRVVPSKKPSAKKHKKASDGTAGSAPELLSMLTLLNRYGIKDHKTLEQVLSTAPRPPTLPSLSDLHFTQYYGEPGHIDMRVIPQRQQHEQKEGKAVVEGAGSSEDNEHSVESQMLPSVLQQEWDNIFERCQNAVVNLLRATHVDSNAQACWAVENISNELEELYYDVRGTLDEVSGRTRCLFQYHVLLSMMSCIIRRVMEKSALTTSFLGGERNHLRAILAQRLSREGLASERLLRALDYDFIMSESFSKGSVVKCALDASHQWTDVLHPHLALMCADTLALSTLPAHERIFQQELEKILYRALSLEARLRVAEGYHISQPEHLQPFSKASMSSLHETNDNKKLLVVLTVLPAIVKKDGKVVCKAMVVCEEGNTRLT